MYLGRPSKGGGGTSDSEYLGGAKPYVCGCKLTGPRKFLYLDSLR